MTEHAFHNPHAPLLAKWLRYLFLCQAGDLILSAAALIFTGIGLLPWLSRILSLAGIFCLFQLSCAWGRYRKAAVFQLIHFGTILLSLLVNPLASLLNLAGSVFSLLAMYQEYSAHSEIIAGILPKLSRSWHSLFNWQIGAIVLSTVAAPFLVVLGILARLENELITTLTMAVVSLTGMCLHTVYLAFLHKTAGAFR